MSSESTKKAPNVVFAVAKDRPNVVLNWNENPEGEFFFYGDAYHDAGKKLLVAYAASRGRAYDFDAVPIVFL